MRNDLPAKGDDLGLLRALHNHLGKDQVEFTLREFKEVAYKYWYIQTKDKNSANVFANNPNVIKRLINTYHLIDYYQNDYPLDIKFDNSDYINFKISKKGLDVIYGRVS